MRELRALLAQREYDLDPWMIGKIPHHYKRLNIPMERAKEYAKKGAAVIYSKFGDTLFFTQALLAGAIFSDDFDEYIIVSCSQYGKSWLMGMIALAMADSGEKVRIAGGSAQLTDIIMDYALKATQKASREIQSHLMMKKDKLEKLVTSTSKTKLSFTNGGYLEPISLGESYSGNIRHNQAVGRGSHFILDEAALISEDVFAEMGRREFASVDGKAMKMVMISNPHQPGPFYDKLTEENPPKRRLIVWMDALTAVEEERFNEDVVLNSDFAKNKSTRKRYLLCELDTDGTGMFDVPKLSEKPLSGDYIQYFMGVDAAYKGKDNIEVTITAVGNGKMQVQTTKKIVKKEWVEGKTPKDIIRSIARIAYSYPVSMVLVDEGWGVWLVEGLRDRGLNVRGVNFASAPTKERQRNRHYAATNAQNKRAEMHLDLQDFIENDVLEVTKEVYDEIRDTMLCVTSERKANGKILIRPKEEIKAIIGHSPDAFDSVLLSVHAAVTFLGDSAYAIP